MDVLSWETILIFCIWAQFSDKCFKEYQKHIVLVTFIPFNDLAPSNTQKTILITFKLVNLLF